MNSEETPVLASPSYPMHGTFLNSDGLSRPTRDASKKRTHFAEFSPTKASENAQDQPRFAFQRRKRESKTSNLLITAKDEKLPAKAEKIEKMNEMLESQKKNELSRFVYEKIGAILDKDEETKTTAANLHETQAFDAETEYELARSAGKSQEIRSCFLEIVEMSALERKFVDLQALPADSWRTSARRLWLHARKHVSSLCLRVIRHPGFELLTLAVVTTNCITILLDNSGQTSAILSEVDTFFFVFYLTELALKVAALGFLLNEGAYLSDGWNKLDFLVIVTAILNKIIADYNLPAIRALRVLRPLKVIANLKQLQGILESLFSALPLLADSFLILCFCYLLYALAGLQLFSGLLKRRCIFQETGLFSAISLCGNAACGQAEVCAKGLENPKFGIMSFDDVFHSFLNVFQIVTMDNWTVIMYSMQKTFTNFVSVYFLSLVIIGGLFLVNLTLAIIKYKFSNIKGNSSSSEESSAENLESSLKAENPSRSSLTKRESPADSQGKSRALDGENAKTVYDFLLLREKGVWRRRKSVAAGESLPSLGKISTKSAKNSKKSNNLNIFSMRILSNLRTELGKFTNEISSYANELGKATLQIGRTVGVGKLIKAVNRISPINLLKKPKIADLLMDDATSAKKIEDLDPKYLKLRVNSAKCFESSSENDVFAEIRPVSKRKALVSVGTAFKTRGLAGKTRRRSRTRRTARKILRIPRYVAEKAQKFAISRVPLRNRHFSLLKSRRKSEIMEKTQFMVSSVRNFRALPGNPANFVNRNRRFLDNFNGNSMKYHEIRAKLREEIPLDAPKLRELEAKHFTNAESFLEITKLRKEKNSWSGNSVLRESYSDRRAHVEGIFKVLAENFHEISVLGLDRLFLLTSRFFRAFVETAWFSQLILLTVLTNAALLCMEGLISDEVLINFNYGFTGIFVAEMFCKLLGLGVRGYFRDLYNRMDCAIVLLSLAEILLTFAAVSLQSLRFLRSIRVFRVFRLLRRLDYVKKIANFIVKSFSSFIYIAFLLLLFNFVYGLLGMELFTDDSPQISDLKAYSFRDFGSAFMCAFDILTLDNWSNILIIGKKSDAGLLQTAIYSISWIFIGNYILMNLFLAVLLDGVTNELIDSESKKQENIRLARLSSRKAKETQIVREIHELLARKPEDLLLEKPSFSKFVSYDTQNSQISKKISQISSLKSGENAAENHGISQRCEYSLFVFGKTSCFRRRCHRLVAHNAFEALVLLIIFLSSAKMVADTYVDGESPALDMLDNAITGFFVVECLLKIVAQGFCLDEGAYLRESWNQLDFFIVVSSVASYLLEQLSIPFIKVVRILRVMRPLRFISKNANIKIVVVALLDSLHGILNVSLVILMLWVMFASFGISIYRDRFGYCQDTDNFNVGVNECRVPWTNYEYNFDNIYSAMFTLLVIATFDGWMPILGVAVNSNLPENGPTVDNSRYLSYAYFVVFIIVIPIFFINLFIGVIFYHFVISEKKFKNVLLTDSQIRWIQLQKLIITLEPKYAQLRQPANRFRRLCYRVIHHRYFEILVLLIICGSIVNMALSYDDAPADFLARLEVVDQVFMGFFVVEIAVKVLGLGVLGYFSQKWNQFDFFIVVFGITDLLMNSFFSKEMLVFQTGPKILRAVRMLRIGRLLRLIKKFDGMLKILQTLVFSLPMTFNVLALLLLIFFVYTIIGCSLFGDIPMDDYVNFKNFLFGMMTLFKMSTTDDWSSTMLAVLKHNVYCPVYFVSFIIISQFILTNLFILVLLQQFADAEQSDKNPLQEFNEYVSKFRNAWIECTEKFKGEKMQKTSLLKFFRSLEPPLGLKDEENIDVIYKFIMEMKIVSDKDGFIYFNELLFKTMRNVYGAAIFEASNEAILLELKKHERKTAHQLALKLQKKHRVQYFKRIFHKANKNSVIPQSNRRGNNFINPLSDYLYIKLAFFSWRNYSINLKNKADTIMCNQESMVLTLGDSESSENSEIIPEEIEEEQGCFPTEQEIDQEKEINDFDIDFNGNYWGNLQEKDMQLPNQVDN